MPVDFSRPSRNRLAVSLSWLFLFVSESWLPFQLFSRTSSAKVASSSSALVYRVPSFPKLSATGRDHTSAALVFYSNPVQATASARWASSHYFKSRA